MFSLLSILILLATNAMSFIVFAEDIENNENQEQTDVDLYPVESEFWEMELLSSWSDKQQIIDYDSDNENHWIVTEDWDGKNNNEDDKVLLNPDSNDNISNIGGMLYKANLLTSSADNVTLGDDCLQINYFTRWTYSTTILTWYTCNDGWNIVIPEWIEYVDWPLFAWKEIYSITIPDSVTLQNDVFSWAILNWDIIIENKDNIGGYAFEWAIIWQKWKVTLWDKYVLSDVEVKEWGVLNIVWDNFTRMSSRMKIDWILNINTDWLIISNSLQYMKLWVNWQINFNNWITTITDNTFWSSDLSWTINLPTTLIEFWNTSFWNARIYTWIIFPNSLELIDSSAFQSATITWDLLFWESNTTIKWFSSAKINWNFLFTWTTFNFESISSISISWSLIWTDCWDVGFRTSSFWNISWDFKIISNWNFNISQWWLGIWRINWDLVLSWNGISLLSVLRWTKITWNLNIQGNDIKVKYWALNGLNVDWDFIMKWNLIDLDTDVVNEVTIWGNLLLDAKLLKAQNSVLNSIKIWWWLKIPDNSILWERVLWWIISKSNSAMSYNTTVSIWEEVDKKFIDDVNVVVDEIIFSDTYNLDNKTIVKNIEIQASSGKVIKFQWWIDVSFENIMSEIPVKLEWTANFSSPIAIKVPVNDYDNEYVKIRVKHTNDEEFWYSWLTLVYENNCVEWIPEHDQYTWEYIKVDENEGIRYAVIYTCSASTFIAYSEDDYAEESDKVLNNSELISSPSAWGGRTIINTTSNIQEKEHNSADISEEKEETENKTSTTTSDNTVTVEENIKKYSNIKLTRWEVAVMTNILLDVFPQLVEWKQELDDVENACSNYADEQKFTKDEKKAIARLCKLSIMWIHADNNRPLEEFLVNNNTTNDEFSKVINRSISTYNEKDLSAVKDALKKLENNEDDVAFWTLYDMFMSIKSLIN